MSFGVIGMLRTFEEICLCFDGLVLQDIGLGIWKSVVGEPENVC